MWRKARASRLMIGTTSCPPATARAPPGMKSFWTSTTRRISRSPGVILVMLLCPGEQALHKSAHLVAVPLTRAAGAARHCATGTDEERRRQPRDPPSAGRLELGVEQDREGQVEVPHVRLDESARRSPVHGHGKDDEATVTVRVPQRLERRHLERARLAPRSPEVQDDQLVRVVGKRGRPPVERCEPERRPVLTLGELVDAGLLERVERRGRVSRMMAALLTWPPERQRPEEAPAQEGGAAGPHERLIPADAEETRPPASHVSPDSPAAPSRRPRTRSVLSP